ncbi:diphthamide biosynthesis enzyme Dph2 [Sulfuracidifex tepidarius]|uniref:diphthamide biosynthesis enzyme Dph2 n=1 Tax=Sulfuracidifex tepidarius TaxID=1294262 RepID=UPI0011F36FD1|nr:diphthamide biosynthesis enzyme Dph2 [Sulfuracidifex tepidarius]
MPYDFQENYVIQEIKKRGAKRILLQFPEGLRYFSSDIVKDISSALPNVEIIVSGDSSWGACDVAEHEARQLGADLIVHYGHSPYTWYYPKFPTIFVETKSTLSLGEKLIKETLDLLLKYKPRKVGLTATVQHVSSIPYVKERLEKEGFQVEVGKPSNPFMHDGQVLGCDYKAGLNVDADLYVNISGGLFHSLGLGLATGKPVIKADPYSDSAEDITKEVYKFLKIRYGKIMQAMSAKSWVIIRGTMTGQDRPMMVKFLNSELKRKGFEVMIVSSRVLNVEVLRNLDRPSIDAFIVTSCPRLPTDDLYGYEKPVLTPGEAKMVINNKLDPYIFPW